MDAAPSRRFGHAGVPLGYHLLRLFGREQSDTAQGLMRIGHKSLQEAQEMANRLLGEPITVRGAAYELPRGPGLGVQVDEAKLRELAGSGAE